MKQTSVILLCVTLITTNLYCQNTTQRLDSLFNSLYSYRQINGNVLIAEKGNIIYKKSFGYADIEKKILNNDGSEFTLASISKVFTSTAILQLRDKGKLTLDDPFVKFFHDFPYPDITIRNLLSHTSGLPDYDLYEEQINKNPDKIFSNKDILPSLKNWKEPLHFKPGENWEYSNTNFCLLALLVEKLSGFEFKKYIQKYIFTRAEMNNTYFQTDAVNKLDIQKAINYEYPWLFSSKQENVDNLPKYRWRLYNASGFVGQGNIITTTEDLLKFDHALYSGKIIKPSTLAEAYTPTKLKTGENAFAGIGLGKASYGLGWFILEDTTSGKIVWHTGGQPGGLGIFVRNISKKQTVIIFDNTFNKSLYGNGFNAIAILNDKPVKIRKTSMIQDYGISLVEKGVDAAFCRLSELRADSAHYDLDEGDMNELGLQLLYAGEFEGHNELALEVLKLNTLLFPLGFNTYDSYGEALAKQGKVKEAIFMYNKSLELNPKNEGGRKALKELLNR
jgi:CubicO group peptidase (beta-lactamase class C family)